MPVDIISLHNETEDACLAGR